MPIFSFKTCLIYFFLFRIKQITKKVPDTITKWIITGFSIDKNRGFGMTDVPTELNVFYKFFISINLPHKIIRGEVIEIIVTVYNYQSFNLSATVVFDNNLNQFEFITDQGSSECKFYNTFMYKRSFIKT